MNEAQVDQQLLQDEGGEWLQLENDLNALWVLLGAYLVFIMQVTGLNFGVWLDSEEMEGAPGS